jgi:hypothetical protein
MEFNENKIMKELEIVKVNNWRNFPKTFTGIVETPNGDKFWYKDGKLHKEDGPAIDCIDGSRKWWIEGKLHREDGPAVEFSDGTKWWYKQGKCHREDGPAKMWANGHKEWRVEGKEFKQINLKDYVILDYDKGKFDLMWYKLLDKDKVFECPDVPGLIWKK